MTRPEDSEPTSQVPEKAHEGSPTEPLPNQEAVPSARSIEPPSAPTQAATAAESPAAAATVAPAAPATVATAAPATSSRPSWRERLRSTPVVAGLALLLGAGLGGSVVAASMWDSHHKKQGQRHQWKERNNADARPGGKDRGNGPQHQGRGQHRQGPGEGRQHGNKGANPKKSGPSVSPTVTTSPTAVPGTATAKP